MLRRLFIHTIIIITTLNIVTYNQFSKLPNVIVHYFEHSTLDHKITFVDFLSMHYWGHDINDQDDEKDKQLPFKTCKAEAVQHYLQPGRLAIAEPEYYPASEALLLPSGQAAVADGILNSILRPPSII